MGTEISHTEFRCLLKKIYICMRLASSLVEIWAAEPVS